MANNGYRQLGEPRIGIFCDRQRPDPLHLKINSWQHILDLIYVLYIEKGNFEKMEEVQGLLK
jgi:hypothetical protein